MVALFLLATIGICLSNSNPLCELARNDLTQHECVVTANAQDADVENITLTRANGDLGSYQTGSFSPQNQSYTYSLNYNGPNNAAYSIFATSAYGVKLTVYYLDSGLSYPFIVANNTISFLPVSAVRTAYVRVQPLVFKQTYTFGIMATQISNPSSSYDYVTYSPTSHSLVAGSYSATGNSLCLTPSSSITYSFSDMDSPTADGVREVNSSSYPYSAVARTASSLHHSSGGWTLYGTAFRIQNGIFGTAAHCLFDKDNWAFPHSSTFYVNQHGTTYDSLLSIAKYVIPIGYILGDATENRDYGFAITGDDSSSAYLGFDATETVTVSSAVWAVGYPGYSYANNNMFWTGGTTTAIDSVSKVLKADYPYAGGGSGSPVFKNGKVVGIHIGAIYEGDVRTGSVIKSLSSGFQSLCMTAILNYL